MGTNYIQTNTVFSFFFFFGEGLEFFMHQLDKFFIFLNIFKMLYFIYLGVSESFSSHYRYTISPFGGLSFPVHSLADILTI